MAPTKTQTLIALLGMSSVNAYSSTANIISCLNTPANTFYMGAPNAGLQDANTAPTFKDGGCCTAGDTDADCAAATACSDASAFCATGSDGAQVINNRFLKEFMWPSDASNCPDDTNILIDSTGTEIIKKHTFSGVMPNSNAEFWHCKWKVSAASSLLPQAIGGTTIAERDTNGWIQLEVLPVGFDKNVVVVMQPPEKYYDFNYRSLTNNPEKASYVGKSQYGRKYVFPAEYDVFIDVSPYAYNAGSDEQPTEDGGGSVQFRIQHLSTNPTPAGDSTWSEVKRIEKLADPVTEDNEADITPVDEDASDIEQLAVVDDSELPDTKKDFDGNVVSQGERWGTGTAFTIGDTEITNEQVAATSGVVVALIIIIVVMCCFFSYIERKKIAAEGRRLSTAVRRASTKLRRGSSAATENPNDKEMTGKDIENMKSHGNTKNEKNFLQDLGQHNKDMQASATSIHNEQAAGGGVAKGDQSIDGLPKADGDYKDPVV